MIYVQKNALLESGFKMIDSYKNIERLRYRINKDLLALCADIKKNNEEQRIMFIDECFSVVASSIAGLFLTQTTFEPLKEFLQFISTFLFEKSIPIFVISVISAVLCIIILLFVSLQINKILIAIKRWKSIKGPEGIDTTDYIKEFDNIACDSVIVSMEYKDMFFSTLDINEKTLYYLEAVHYLETASLITEKLCADVKNIKTSKNVWGVDVYRIHNMKAVMSEVWECLYDQITNLALDENDINAVKTNFSEIRDRVNSITF